MTIYRIDPFTKLPDRHSWSIDKTNLSVLQPIFDYKKAIAELRENAHWLQETPIEDLVDFFDSLAEHGLAKKAAWLRKFQVLGTPFLIPFLKKNNLRRLLSASLHGNLSYLDTFVEMPEIGKKVMAQPRGLATHWIAGNVLILGIISLVQGILSKNANVIKVPADHGLILPEFFFNIADFRLKKNCLSGTHILSTVLFVYCEKEDLESQELMSLNTDTRVIWGGKDAVNNVLALPKNSYTQDIVFGPKYSLAVIGRDSFEAKDLNTIACNLALDASLFEQRACSSPHAVFIEEGGKVAPLDFAKALARGMEKVLRRYPKTMVTADEAYSVVTVRSESLLSGEVFSSKGTEWTVIYSKEKDWTEPCTSRVVFVRPVADVNEVIRLVDRRLQTLGLLLDDKRKIAFAKEVTARGIERITDIGKMNMFDYPWDGMFPLERLIRWVSLDSYERMQ